MGCKLMTRMMAIVLTTAMLIGLVQVSSVKAESTGETTQSVEAAVTGAGTQSTEYLSELLTTNYTKVSASYTAPLYSGEPIRYGVDSVYKGSDPLTDANAGYDHSVLAVQIGDIVDLAIEVPETAQYYLRFDYCSADDSILPMEFAMRINGAYPFYECRRLSFESTWTSDGDTTIDRYGNEIVSVPDKLIQWESKYLMDASYRHSYALKLELSAGLNEIQLEALEGSFLLGDLYLEKGTAVPDYTGSEIAAGSAMVDVIQGEDFTYRNDSSIRAIAEFDSNLDPYKITDTVLNTVDSDSFKTAGQKITYEFEIDTAGYYYIATNYRQSDKNDFPVFVDVAIDGAIPNNAFSAYPFEYSTKYKTMALRDDKGKNLSVYLEAGTHTISYTLNNDNICNVLESVDVIMSAVNDLALEITKVAGTNKEKYRDLDLIAYIPDIIERMESWAHELDALHESIKKYNPDVNKIAAFSSITIAAKLIRDLASEPEELSYRVSELCANTSSVNQHLANLVDILNKNKLSIDRIFIYQEDANLPSKIGFIKSFGMSIKRFFASFFDQAYSVSNVDDAHLQVWVNRSRQHLEIMQKMIDEQFTADTGIEVDLSLMPDQQKLILANASGDAPDIATGINYAIPFDLAIRGAITDLTQFEGFEEVLNQYSTGLHIPATFENGIYAVPETMNFWVLFYRTDILSKLGLAVPDTIDDVIAMLPDLQMRGLNFYYPTAGMIAMRNFHGTTPLLFQSGASLYGTYAGNTTLNSDKAIEGFTLLTELFTIYNLDVDIPNFYQHFRNGDLPIGIGDYGVYNLLKNAAPEIANSWAIAPVPGIEQEDGTVLRYTAGGAESTVMFKSTSEREAQAWEFMKWWSSAEVQTEYGQTLQISYGDEYIWHTANLEAFESLPWSTKDKQVILKQAEWILEAPRILGTYMLEREMSNAFNAIVVDGEQLRIRLDNAVKDIDRETERKLEEFGYIKDGIVVKEYIVPTLDIVNKILGNTQ